MARPRAARASAPLVVCPNAGEPLARALAEGLADAWIADSFTTDRPDVVVPLAIGVFPEGDTGVERFTAEAHRVGIPSLAVVHAASEALVGPLSIPGRAGCGACGRRRLSAAAVARRRVVESGPAAFAVEVVLDEVATILRRGAEASDLLDHVLAVEPDGESLHRVIPVPWCELCGGPLSSEGAVVPSVDDEPEEVLAALSGWVDVRTGVTSALAFDEEDGFPVVVSAAPPHVVENDGSVRQLPAGWGKGLTRSAALLSAVGETIERYAASLPDPARLVWAGPDELDGDVLDPRTLPLYDERQYARAGFPFARFDAGAPHPWVLGRWLESDVPVWVPAVFVFLALDLHRPEQLFVQGTSNGLAASTDLADAERRAVMELVERDALLVAWRTGTRGTPVHRDALLPELQRVVDAVERTGASVELYVLPTAAVGTAALCLARGDGRSWPGAVVGLGADRAPDLAMQQAVLELGQTGPHLRRLMQTGAVAVPEEAKEVRTMLDHAAYWFSPERAAAFDRLRSDEEPLVSLGAPDDRPLSAAGIRVAVVDVTSPDVATGPFRVVRAVSPDLQPLTYGFGLERLPVPRAAAADDVPPVHPVW